MFTKWNAFNHAHHIQLLNRLGPLGSFKSRPLRQTFSLLDLKVGRLSNRYVILKYP